MTEVPAQVLGLTGRGVLEKNAIADVVVFDPEKIQDLSVYANPHQFAVGMEWVFVNGKVAIENGKALGARNGVILKRL